MKQTLSALYRGDIDPMDEKTEKDEKVKNLCCNIDNCYNILWNKLDGDGKQLLSKLKDYHTELSHTEKEDAFIQGFSLAVKLMTEAISG